MSSRSTAQVTPGGATFALDRFELVEDERYEVEGRWSGIRGRVFMRPELTLIDGEHSRRLLADLAQKPWQAGDGDKWTAAFPCGGDPARVVVAELTVAPDITVTVKRGRARSPRTEPGARPQQRTRAQSAARRRGLGAQLAEAHAALLQLQGEHTRQTARLDAAKHRVDDARAERDRVIAHRDELQEVHDAVIREHDAAMTERAQVIRDAAIEREAIERERDEARAELELMRGELTRAQQTVQKLSAERDAAIRAGVEVERELSAARAERENLISERQQPVVLPRPVAASAPPLPAPDFSWGADHRTGSRGPRTLSRALALAALVAAIVVVVILLANVL